MLSSSTAEAIQQGVTRERHSQPRAQEVEVVLGAENVGAENEHICCREGDGLADQVAQTRVNVSHDNQPNKPALSGSEGT